LGGLATGADGFEVGVEFEFGFEVEFEFGFEVDLLVEFEPEAHVGLLALDRLQRELTALFGRQVDLVPVLGLKPIVRAEVLATRELLYAA
jgi:predicted nucleotidyltransferase